MNITKLLPILLYILPSFVNALPFNSRTQLVAYLQSISGTHTITGQHNREPNSDPAIWSRKVNDITGVLPALWGGDFLFQPDDVRDRGIMIDEAIRQWNAGSLVALTWHMCPPTVGETCWWDSDGILSSLTNAQWADLVTEGGNLNRLFKTRMDTIVPHLRRLKDAGVIAIFRPVHEMNEAWSWWGGRPGPEGSAELYRMMYEYYTQQHGLDNLVWTWCVKDVEMGSIGAYWPGGPFVDVASLDMWMKRYPTSGDYQAMLSVSEGKPIALAETGSVPTPSVLREQSRWVWFMVWAEYLVDSDFNSEDGIKETYYMSETLHQGDINP